MENVFSTFHEIASSFEGDVFPCDRPFVLEWNPTNPSGGSTRVVQHIRENIRSEACFFVVLGLRPRGIEDKVVKLECLLNNVAYELEAGDDGWFFVTPSIVPPNHLWINPCEWEDFDVRVTTEQGEVILNPRVDQFMPLPEMYSSVSETWSQIYIFPEIAADVFGTD